MEFLRKNFIDTTTSITVNSNTGTVANIMNRDLTFQYASSGLNDDTTISTFKISFEETQSVSRIALMGINVKGMNIFYDEVTANTFDLTTTGDTTASQWVSNSETSMFLKFAAVDCTSVSFDFKTTMEADANKAIGYLLVSNKHMTFDRVPNAFNYQPSIDPKSIVHTLSDGGTRVQTLAEKRSVRVALNYITTSFRNNLKNIYDLHDEIVFCAFGTTTGWDEVLFPCSWVNGFEFNRFSDNAAAAGFEGSILLKESTL